VNEQILPVAEASLSLVVFNSHGSSSRHILAAFTIFFSAGTVCNKTFVSDFRLENALMDFLNFGFLPIRGYPNVSARIVITQLTLMIKSVKIDSENTLSLSLNQQKR
jgi:hypothetical protein